MKTKTLVPGMAPKTRLGRISDSPLLRQLLDLFVQSRDLGITAHDFAIFADMIDQDIVDGDDTVVGVACGRIVLEELESALIELEGIPVGIGEEAVETGLVGDVGELAVDAQNGLAFGDEEAGEVLSEMASLGIVGERTVEVTLWPPDRAYLKGGRPQTASQPLLAERETKRPGSVSAASRGRVPMLS